MSRFFFSGGLRRTGLMMALVFTLVLAALPAAVFAAPVSSDYGYGHGCGNCYVVKAGDSLSQIAKHFGVNYHELARYNGIADPSLIYVGQVLRIPHGGGGYHPGHGKKDDCGGCGYHKDDHKDDCGDCGYHKKHDHKNDCYDCGYHKDNHKKNDCGGCYDKGHDKHGCGSCGYSYDSYSGYLYGSHYESYTLTDEYNYGYNFSGYDYRKK